jgi:AcrR family transcriptional regulator
VVEEAAALADQVGLEQVTFARLAQILGVSAPALYKHVDGLEQLHRDLTVLGATELWARIRDAAVGKSRRDALFATAEAYRQYARERPGLIGVVVRAPSPDDAELVAAAEAGLAVLRGVLAGYELSEDDEIHAMRELRVVAHGFATLENAGGFGLSQSLDETYRRLLDALDRSLSR